MYEATPAINPIPANIKNKYVSLFLFFSFILRNFSLNIHN